MPKRINDAFDRYIFDQLLARNMSAKTVESYKETQKNVERVISNKLLLRTSADDVRRLYLELTKTQSRSTARLHFMNFRSVLKYENRTRTRIAGIEELQTPKREKKSVEFMTDEEVERFIRLVGEPRRGYSKEMRLRNVAICWVLWSSGIRVSELCALDLGTIKNRQFVVIGKSKSPRVCFINIETEQAIENYLETRTDSSNALFVTQQGERIKPRDVRYCMHSASKSAGGKNIHPHTFRHSYATQLLNNGIDIRFVSQMLGHESLDTTRIYTHVVDTQLKRLHDSVF